MVYREKLEQNLRIVDKIYLCGKDEENLQYVTQKSEKQRFEKKIIRMFERHQKKKFARELKKN